MATIREYFDNDVKVMSSHVDWQFGPVDGPMTTFRAKVAMDFEANAKYWYFYIPSEVDFAELVASVLAQQETQECNLRAGGDGMFVDCGFTDYSERTNSRT